MMITKRLRSVRQKLLLMVLVANLCTLVAAGGALLYHDLAEGREKTAAALSALADILGQGNTTALEFDDRKVAAENLAELRANPNIIAAALYTPKGGLFASYVREPKYQNALPDAPASDGFHFDADELSLFKRIGTPRDMRGTVYLRERHDLSKWLRDYLIILGAVLAGSLLLGLLISSRLQRWISEPIKAVSTVAQQVMEQRDYRLRATKTTEDEIGRLADAFNGMLAVLEHEIAERSSAENAVRSLNADLEQRVAERTAELRVTNQALAARTDEAEAANRAKAAFLANMSHEIRTPMNAILGLAYLLDQKSLDSDAADLVKKIRNAGRSLQSIINDILDFSKIEAGRLDLEQAPFRLSDVFDNLSSVMAANAGAKDIELLIAPPPDVGGRVHGDALRLEQILINLTGNAIKFTDQGSVRVDIKLLARDAKIATLRFSVRDTGIGIPLDKQSQIFAAFSQADVSTTRRFGGTGLGLTICRHLVGMMGGEIGVISEPGRGSEFWFTVPFEWSAAVEETPAELSGLDVLIADDSEIARENLALTARSVGWSAALAESGEMAIQKAEARLGDGRPYDVLLLDWKMPGVDGLAAAATIRQTCRADAMPIVLMVTAFSRDELLKQPDIDKIDGVLSKPVTGSSLYNSVAHAMQRRGCNIGGGLRASAVGKGKRIPGIRALVVDDSDINREVAQRILQAEGGIVSLAEHGQAALEWLVAHPSDVDIVLMDVQMPVMDGYEATQRLRESPELAALPVIALTAGAFKAQQDAARAAGMNGFVAKPFNVDELIAAIQQLTHFRPEFSAADVGEADGDSRPAEPAVDDLPGIAVGKGLEIWTDMTVYLSFLQKFAGDYADYARQLAAGSASGEHAAVRALAHKLKGTAGNLALTDVARHAARVEAMEPGADNADEALNGLQSALDVALASIARLAAPSVKSAASTRDSSDVASAAPLLAALRQALDTDNPDQVTPILDQLASVLAHDALDQLRRSVNDFDFRGAEQRLHELADGLGVDSAA